jgi:hypothetical protein
LERLAPDAVAGAVLLGDVLRVAWNRVIFDD